MIVDERFRSYINSLERGNGELLDELEQEALRSDVPIIRKEMQSFLKMMMVMNKPKQILEVGTAIGFSALLMAQYAPVDCHITTIENYEKRIPLARENFIRFGQSERITLLEGDAAKLLPQLTGRFDFIFMDAAKGQYIHYLPDVLRLLRMGGVLISDNVLQDGDIIESHYVITRRNRTIHTRMREYLYTLKNHPLLETSIVPLGDGITISVKKET
ncbi:MAG: O-methyltransferase [Lachnospiraceae bacterium]|nr:O-methyltransferase [Lachnospiraceae bacterium]